MKKASRYEVYWLDMWANPDEGWTLNSKYKLGEVEITPEHGDDVDKSDVIRALRGFSFTDVVGLERPALCTTDQSIVFAEDYYGTGEWWEVGAVSVGCPVYGLELMEDAS